MPLIPDLMTQWVDVLTPGVTVDRGREVEDWTSPTVTRMAPASVQPGAGDRDHWHADGVTADYTVFLPPTFTVDPRARLRIPMEEGDFLQVEPPQKWIVGSSLDHLRLRLRRRDD